MYEVEVKVRAEHERVRDRLSEIEATEVGRVEQVDTYYNAPHRDFAETDEALRIREETENVAAADEVQSDEATSDGATTATLTYKGPLVEQASKTRRELETVIDAPESMAAILDALGFEPVATVHKRRERYRVGEFAVTLDAIEELGEFVEVDAEAEESEIEPTRERAYDVLADLGIDPDEQIRTSYLELVLEERAE